jgi:hypothetical protein
MPAYNRKVGRELGRQKYAERLMVALPKALSKDPCLPDQHGDEVAE